MTLDWNSFTPWTSLGGGLLIGLAASLFVLLNGRIAGISGVLGGLLRPRGGDTAWRVAFIVGMLLAPSLYALVWRMPESEITASTPVLIAAGLLVGIGTRFGSGCTSGHGVCGLARGSARSLVATLSFMLAGFATVFVVRHVMGG
ncbi:MAG: YeeE/YedE family protein [Gammaproteobacteria bacterium]|nr:YeeE/YedE family protein [Gammaproteobacteria bacterium]